MHRHSTRRLPLLLPFFLGLLALLFASSAPAQKPDDPGMVKFRGAAFPVSEEAGEVTIVVKRLRGSTGDVSVAYRTVDGSAVAGVDYTMVDDVLGWTDGDRSDKTFTVEILDNDEPEGQKTFGVELYDPVGGVELSPPSTAVVRIKPSDRSDEDDDDEPLGPEGPENGVVKLTSATFPAFEASGQAEVTVERTDGSDGEVMVDVVTLDGSAMAPDDYTETIETLTWADGEDGEKSFLVPLVDDTEEEPLETINLLLANPSGGVALGVRDVASIVVIDDDGGEGSCVPDETTLCLLDGRFQITGSWLDFDDNTGDIHWIPSSAESGLGWFFNEENIEILLKVLDACPINDSYWVFFAATTNVGYTLEVSDLVSGDVQTYENPRGEIAFAVADTSAFACSE